MKRAGLENRLTLLLAVVGLLSSPPAASMDVGTTTDKLTALSNQVFGPSTRQSAPSPLAASVGVEHIRDGGCEGGPGPISYGEQGLSGSGVWSWWNAEIADNGSLYYEKHLNPIWRNQGGVNAHTGLYMFYLNPFGPTVTDVSQFLTINPGHKATLSFWLRVGAGQSASNEDAFMVFFTDHGSNTWTVVGGVDYFTSANRFGDNTGYWKQYVYDVSRFAGKTVDIHFRSYVVSTCVFQLDDISLISSPVPTPTPTPTPGPAVVSSFVMSPSPVALGQPVTFADTSTGAPTSWFWTFGDGGGSSARNPVHVYTAPGDYAVSLIASNSRWASTKTQYLTVLPASGSIITKVIPIVLDVVNGTTRFSSEVTLANRGTTAVSLAMSYTPATALGSSGGGTVSEVLGPGKQLVIPDAIAYLRQKGLSIPLGSNQGGTLRVTFTGLSSADVAFAGARTTAPSGGGRAGLAYPGIRMDEGLTGRCWLYGLRQTPTDRTNLALLNMDASNPITLRVTLHSGFDSSSVTLPDVALGPGQWTQIGRVLDGAGYANGYAEVDFVSGTGPYYAYAVFNDSATNDGSFVPPTVTSSVAETLLLPVLVETATFNSELVLTNPFGQTAVASLTYSEALSPGDGPGGSSTETLLPYEQKVIGNAVDYLRGKGIAIGARGAASYAGSLRVSFAANGSTSYGFVGARTAAPADGGQYGLFYRALGISEASETDAYVFGLQQNLAVRSNLAVANAGDSGPVTFKVEIYNGDTGTLWGSSAPMTLPAGGWTQISSVLSTYHVSNAYARIVRQAGASRIMAYGVVNDGATASSGATNDGSYVQFSNR